MNLGCFHTVISSDKVVKQSHSLFHHANKRPLQRSIIRTFDIVKKLVSSSLLSLTSQYFLPSCSMSSKVPNVKTYQEVEYNHVHSLSLYFNYNSQLTI